MLVLFFCNIKRVSEKGMKKRNRIGLLLVGMAVTMFFSIGIESNAAKKESPVETAKNGIVEIQSGFTDSEGKFWRMQYGSGFLVSNTQGSTVIITNNSIVQNSIKARTAYCEKKGIITEGVSYENEIRVVVKGDVLTQASVLASSKTQDYCVLTTESVINEKTALKIENSKKLSKGDTVYAMGFPKPEKGLEYAKENVEVYEGKVEENSDTSLRFSAVISKGSTGGPLLNEEGYVVGISSPMQAEAALGCALPILEIEEILQNFSVIYGNSSWDILTDKMDMLYKECKEISEKGGYKKDSFVELQNALAVVDKLSEQENPSIEELDTAYQTLSAAKASLVPKMKKTTITIYVLAGAGALLLIYFLYLLIMNHKETKAMQDSMQKQSMQPCSLVQESDVDSYVEMKMLQLRKLRNGQVFKISKDDCIIGKSPDMADFVIEGNQAVSRKHAKISKKNNSYYLSDLDSLNGTYLNGRKVRSKEEAVLRIGDIVRIADEEFEVRY